MKELLQTNSLLYMMLSYFFLNEQFK